MVGAGGSLAAALDLTALLRDPAAQLSYLFLLLLVIQRLVELRIARRHSERLEARGAYEVGAEHYPWIVATHTGFFVALSVEIALRGAPVPDWWWAPFILFLLAQLLRVWTIRSLGEHWTTRIYILPGASRITSGPYRYLRHPNYVAVMIEFVTVPLILGAFGTAAVFVPLNAWLLYGVRIPREEAALAKLEQ